MQRGLFFVSVSLLILVICSGAEGKRTLLDAAPVSAANMEYLAADCQTFAEEPTHVCRKALIPACCNMKKALCSIRKDATDACVAPAIVGCCPNFNL